MSDIAHYEKHCQQINQKAFISLVISFCVARLSEPIQHNPFHYKLYQAAVSTHFNEC